MRDGGNKSNTEVMWEGGSKKKGGRKQSKEEGKVEV